MGNPDRTEITGRAPLLRDRQILIRDGDRVRTLTLSARRQVAALVVAGIAMGVPIAVTGGLVYHNQALHGESAANRGAPNAGGELAGGVDAILAHARRLAEPLPAVAPRGVGRPLIAADTGLPALAAVVQRLGEHRARLDRRLANARARYRDATARVTRLERRAQNLEAELQETRGTLRAVSSGRENLGDRLARTLADLHRVRARYQAALTARQAARGRVEALAGERDALAAEKAALTDRVATLSETLAQTRAERDVLLAERATLARRVGELEETLGHVGDAGETDLIARIADLRDSLVTAEDTTERYRARNAALKDKVATLKQRLENVQETQSGLFSHYTTQARNSLSAIEQTVAMTGLDVDRLVRKARQRGANLGGPFVPAAEIPQAVGRPAQKLDRQMQRLRLLQKVLGRLPLTPPLDSYWISSHFGKRRDPYNDRWAMHEGIDLAGQPDLTVHAAAPGTVVHAGWKGGYGRMVAIDHGYGIVSRYGHLKAISVSEGESIEHRGALGKLGNTGRSTGPHVHYEIRVEGEPVDPMNFLKAGKYAFKK